MSQRSAFLTVGAAVGCGLLLFCLGIAAAVGYTRFAPILPSAVDRIAFADNNNNIQVVDPTGGNPVALTTDGTATDPVCLFPTQSPDSRLLVYTQDEGNGTGSVWVSDVSGNVAPRQVGHGTIAVWSWR